jgi:hypothetical protein
VVTVKDAVKNDDESATSIATLRAEFDKKLRTQLQSELAKLVNKRNLINKRHKSDMDRLLRKDQSRNAQIKTLISKHDAAEQKIAALRKEHEEETACLRKSIEALEGKIKSLEAEVYNLQLWCLGAIIRIVLVSSTLPVYPPCNGVLMPSLHPSSTAPALNWAGRRRINLVSRRGSSKREPLVREGKKVSIFCFVGTRTEPDSAQSPPPLASHGRPPSSCCTGRDRSPLKSTRCEWTKSSPSSNVPTETPRA